MNIDVMANAAMASGMDGVNLFNIEYFKHEDQRYHPAARQDHRDHAGNLGRVVARERLRLPDRIAELCEDQITEIVDDESFHRSDKPCGDDVHAAQIIIGKNAA